MTFPTAHRFDPTCPVCSKPVRSGSLVLFEHGDLFHVSCRSQAYRLQAMEGVDYAQTTRRRATRLVGDATRADSPTGRSAARRRQNACPFCGHPATVTDWQPVAPWIAVEGCPCSGFYASAGLSKRLRKLTEEARRAFAARIRQVRATGHEAWCTTKDGTINGPLVVLTERPDRPT